MYKIGERYYNSPQKHYIVVQLDKDEVLDEEEKILIDDLCGYNVKFDCDNTAKIKIFDFDENDYLYLYSYLIRGNSTNEIIY